MRGRWMALGRGTHTPADHAADDEADDEAEPEHPDTGPEAGQESAPAAAGTVPPGTETVPPGAETVPPGPADGQAAAGPHRHRRWVTASLIALIIIVLVAAGGGVAALLTHGFHGKTTVKYRQAAIFSVRTGDCIDVPASGTVVHVVACANPHDAEIFG